MAVGDNLTKQEKLGKPFPRWVTAADTDQIGSHIRYTNARAVGTHANVSATLDGLAGLDDVAGGATQAVANTRANLLKTALIAHMADVWADDAPGAHMIAGATASGVLAAVAAASDLATSITLVNALKAALNDHGDEAGVHFHNDADAVAATITTDPPTTLAHVITDLNDLIDAIRAHIGTNWDTVNA